MRGGIVGGISALVAAGTFVFGFVLFATVLSDYTTGDSDPDRSVTFVVDHQTTLYLWHLVILIVFGVVLVPVVLSIHERLRRDAPELATMATVFGVIWAGLVIAAGMIANIGIGVLDELHSADPGSAGALWSSLDVVQDGLGGGNELVGGLWVALVSAAMLATSAFPKGLARLGIVSGAAGVLTVVPAFEALGALFGLGLIVWFVWVGISMLREARPTSSVAADDSLVAGR
jgi:hypothetical protein